MFPLYGQPQHTFDTLLEGNRTAEGKLAYYGRDADLLIVVNSQIPTNDLIVHFL